MAEKLIISNSECIEEEKINETFDDLFMGMNLLSEYENYRWTIPRTINTLNLDKELVLKNYNDLSKLLEIFEIDWKLLLIKNSHSYLNDLHKKLSLPDKITLWEKITNRNFVLIAKHYNNLLVNFLSKEWLKNNYFFNPSHKGTWGKIMEKIESKNQKEFNIFWEKVISTIYHTNSKWLLSTAITRDLDWEILINDNNWSLNVDNLKNILKLFWNEYKKYKLSWWKNNADDYFSTLSREWTMYNEALHSFLFKKYNFHPSNKDYNTIDWNKLWVTSFNKENVIASIHEFLSDVSALKIDSPDILRILNNSIKGIKINFSKDGYIDNKNIFLPENSAAKIMKSYDYTNTFFLNQLNIILIWKWINPKELIWKQTQRLNILDKELIKNSDELSPENFQKALNEYNKLTNEIENILLENFTSKDMKTIIQAYQVQWEKLMKKIRNP